MSAPTTAAAPRRSRSNAADMPVLRDLSSPLNSRDDPIGDGGGGGTRAATGPTSPLNGNGHRRDAHAGGRLTTTTPTVVNGVAGPAPAPLSPPLQGVQRHVREMVLDDVPVLRSPTWSSEDEMDNAEFNRNFRLKRYAEIREANKRRAAAAKRRTEAELEDNDDSNNKETTAAAARARKNVPAATAAAAVPAARQPVPVVRHPARAPSTTPAATVNMTSGGLPASDPTQGRRSATTLVGVPMRASPRPRPASTGDSPGALGAGECTVVSDPFTSTHKTDGDTTYGSHFASHRTGGGPGAAVGGGGRGVNTSRNGPSSDDDYGYVRALQQQQQQLEDTPVHSAADGQSTHHHPRHASSVFDLTYRQNNSRGIKHYSGYDPMFLHFNLDDAGDTDDETFYEVMYTGGGGDRKKAAAAAAAAVVGVSTTAPQPQRRLNDPRTGASLSFPSAPQPAQRNPGQAPVLPLSLRGPAAAPPAAAATLADQERRAEATAAVVAAARAQRGGGTQPTEAEGDSGAYTVPGTAVSLLADMAYGAAPAAAPEPAGRLPAFVRPLSAQPQQPYEDAHRPFVAPVFSTRNLQPAKAFQGPPPQPPPLPMPPSPRMQSDVAGLTYSAVQRSLSPVKNGPPAAAAPPPQLPRKLGPPMVAPRTFDYGEPDFLFDWSEMDFALPAAPPPWGAALALLPQPVASCRRSTSPGLRATANGTTPSPAARSGTAGSRPAPAAGGGSSTADDDAKELSNLVAEASANPMPFSRAPSGGGNARAVGDRGPQFSFGSAFFAAHKTATPSNATTVKRPAPQQPSSRPVPRQSGPAAVPQHKPAASILKNGGSAAGLIAVRRYDGAAVISGRSDSGSDNNDDDDDDDDDDVYGPVDHKGSEFYFSMFGSVFKPDPHDGGGRQQQRPVSKGDRALPAFLLSNLKVHDNLELDVFETTAAATTRTTDAAPSLPPTEYVSALRHHQPPQQQQQPKQSRGSMRHINSSSGWFNSGMLLPIRNGATTPPQPVAIVTPPPAPPPRFGRRTAAPSGTSPVHSALPEHVQLQQDYTSFFSPDSSAAGAAKKQGGGGNVIVGGRSTTGTRAAAAAASGGNSGIQVLSLGVGGAAAAADLRSSVRPSRTQAPPLYSQLEFRSPCEDALGNLEARRRHDPWQHQHPANRVRTTAGGGNPLWSAMAGGPGVVPTPPLDDEAEGEEMLTSSLQRARSNGNSIAAVRGGVDVDPHVASALDSSSGSPLSRFSSRPTSSGKSSARPGAALSAIEAQPPKPRADLSAAPKGKTKAAK